MFLHKLIANTPFRPEVAPQIKKLQLGFSDQFRAYINGKLIFGGQDEFLSRDCRFLGTID
ncbi:hypothetical protein IC229_30355 [Spirosoma sp. BT702]|uniref:Uncharacterized protein n=1 Tax=Spirosoma profusum TaxID=2771354 RepID=A0A927AV40_9BACT|nr:hypothetical protein [Spirosoma profusum]MBD2704970.1 hypothetical protein [Spirosoma profusum]